MLRILTLFNRLTAMVSKKMSFTLKCRLWLPLEWWFIKCQQCTVPIVLPLITIRTKTCMEESLDMVLPLWCYRARTLTEGTAVVVTDLILISSTCKDHKLYTLRLKLCQQHTQLLTIIWFIHNLRFIQFNHKLWLPILLNKTLNKLNITQQLK